jgi:hypothetical protein
MKVMIFTFNRTAAWWRHIASGLRFASETVLVSDLPDADIDISPAFHRRMRDSGMDRVALEALGEPSCDDVIARCRLLRVLDRQTALRMIGAMWATIVDVLDRERPQLFLCFLVDRYILDLFERALAARGVRYVGVAVGVLPETVMFMSRGQYLPIREPSDEEIDEAVSALVQPQFVPSYVTRQRFGFAQFLKIYAHFTMRWLVFEVLRLARRVPYDYRYLASRSPSSGFRVRLKDWSVMGRVDRNWRVAFDATPIERRVFLALSVNPEAAIEYWVREISLVDYAAVLNRVAERFAEAGFHLYVKDHPSQFGFRQIELIERLLKHRAVTFLPYDVAGQWLVANCGTTFTWTGTVGIQAALAGNRAVVESDVYYRVDDIFVTYRSMDDVDDLPTRVAAYSPPLPLDVTRRVLARHVLRAAAPGAYMSWRGFKPGDPKSIERARSLVRSLNAYLPALAR